MTRVPPSVDSDLTWRCGSGDRRRAARAPRHKPAHELTADEDRTSSTGTGSQRIEEFKALMPRSRKFIVSGHDLLHRLLLRAAAAGRLRAAS